MPEPYPIPQTNALQQVSRTSMQELFAKDCEKLDKADLEAIVLQMQDLRDRLASTTVVRNVRVKKDVTPRAPAQVVESPEEMGY